jgi:hypothetical protein
MSNDIIQQKYNLNNENVYSELYNYFKDEIESHYILIDASISHMCCHRTNFKSLRENLENKINEIKEIEESQLEECNDPYRIGCLEDEENVSTLPPPY